MQKSELNLSQYFMSMSQGVRTKSDQQIIGGSGIQVYYRKRKGVKTEMRGVKVVTD